MNRLVLAIIFAAVLVVLPETAGADICYKTCFRSVRYYVSCGWWGWRRCSRYRSQAYACNHYCRHGGWSSWAAWSTGNCSRTCGLGTRTVTDVRHCNNPAPYNGGRQCSDSSTRIRTETCNLRKCPIHGGWSSWNPTYGRCSKSCGEGTRRAVLTRACTNPTPRYGGRSCSGIDHYTRQEACNRQNCPTDGGWSKFTRRSSTPCTVTCGGGTKRITLVRTCTNPSPQNGGANCKGKSTIVVTRKCKTKGCPIKTLGK